MHAEPPRLDDDGNPIIIEEEPVDERLPEFDLPKLSDLPPPEKTGMVNECTMMPRTTVEQARQEQLLECYKIQEKLAKDGAPPIPMTVLERAIVLPSEMEWYAKEREYPHPGEGLMVNPNPKPKKKKKGKKRRMMRV